MPCAKPTLSANRMQSGAPRLSSARFGRDGTMRMHSWAGAAFSKKKSRLSSTYPKLTCKQADLGLDSAKAPCEAQKEAASIQTSDVSSFNLGKQGCWDEMFQENAQLKKKSHVKMGDPPLPSGALYRFITLSVARSSWILTCSAQIWLISSRDPQTWWLALNQRTRCPQRKVTNPYWPTQAWEALWHSAGP